MQTFFRKELLHLKKRIPFIFVVLFGLLVRTCYIIKYPVPSRDSYTYKGIVETWIATKEISQDFNVSPLALYILKIPFELFEYDIIKGGILINVIAGLLVIYIIMIAFLKVSNSILFSLIAGLLAATHPTFVEYSCQMQRDSLFLLFYALCCFAIINFIKTRKIKNVILCGASAASAYLCRHEGVEAIILGCAALLCSQKHNKRIGTFLLFSSIVLLTIVFWVIIMGLEYKYYLVFLDKFLDRLRFSVPLGFLS